MDYCASMVEKGMRSVIILAASANDYDQAVISAFLKAFPLPIAGGIFPRLIVNDQYYERGVIVLGFPYQCDVQNYFLGNPSEADRTETLLTYLAQNNQSTRNFILFTDAFGNRKEAFIHNLYDILGVEINIVGAGAGYLDFIQRPCLFSNQGLLQNAVQLLAMPIEIYQSSGHGWEVCDGPFLVTEADQNCVETLNYLPAFEVYRAIIEKQSGLQITPSNFFEIAKNFPLGILDVDNNLIVRDPLHTENGSLICAGDIPVNCTVSLLTANKSKLIDSAKQTVSCLPEAGNMLFMIDCISRSLYLQDDFTDELLALHSQHKELPMIGVMPLGEITRLSNHSVGILNKSTVVGLL